MSWRDRKRPASFRGVPFFVAAATTTNTLFGDVQIFPSRTTAGAAVHVEPLGRGPRKFTVDAYVASEEYDQQRDALEAALMEPGPADLIHPYRGQLRVSVTPKPVVTTESAKGEGFARIQFEVVEVRDPAARPVVVVDVAAVSELAAGAVVGAVDVAAITAAPDSVLRSAVAGLDAGLSAALGAHASFARTLAVADEVNRRAATLSSVAAKFASAPTAALATATSTLDAMVSTVVNIADANTRHWEGLDAIYSAIADALTDDQTSRPSTRADEQRARDQLGAVVLGAWLASSGDALTRARHSSRQDALRSRAWWLDRLDGWLSSGAAAGDGPEGTDTYQRFEDLRAAVTSSLDAVASRLPEVRDHVLLADLPALAVAHQVYGDALREAELLERNPQAQPDLIPTGTLLEVETS